MNGTVVIGYDQSAPSEQALLLAAQEAGWRHAVLAVLHAYHCRRPTAPAVFTPPVLQEVHEKAAMEIAEDGAEHARGRYPDLDVRPMARVGPAAHALATAGRDAELIVVGNRGHGGFAGQLLGSVSMRVLAAASCPVIVARGEGEGTHDRVVAAVDIDDPGCADVLAFAFDDAAGRHAELVAVHVWDDDERWVGDLNLKAAGLMKSPEQVLAELDQSLAAHVSQAHARHPEVKASHLIGAGTVGNALVEESERADLVIAGAHRRHGEHAGMRVGPVAATLLHHAGCPVAVVPHA